MSITVDATEEVDSGVDGRVREARLVKMVESLKRRLEQLKGENEQLEEMLRQADARVSGLPIKILSLQYTYRSLEGHRISEATKAFYRFMTQTYPLMIDL